MIVLPVLAQYPPGTQPPTTQEQQLFQGKLNRLKGNATSMPISVNETIDSLSKNITKSFNCTQGSRVSKVTITITTTFVHWNRSLIVEKDLTDVAGYYQWTPAGWTITSGRKNLTFHNWVMLDPVLMNESENYPPLGPLIDEGLLYHELLHGQFLINAMDLANWQSIACNCSFDYQPTDRNHTKISPAVDGYIDNRTRSIANVTILEIPPQQADPNGNFSIDLGTTNKEEYMWRLMEPQGSSNVKMSNISVTVNESGHIIVNGTLINTSEKGKFYLWFDPPREWIISGIEEPIVVLPFVPPVTTTPMPATSTAGITALIGIFLVASMLHKIKRRQ